MIWYLIGILDAMACGFVLLCGYGVAKRKSNLPEREMAIHTSGGRSGQKPHGNRGQNNTKNGTELTENHESSGLLLQDAQRQVTRLFKGKA
jgi:hypothetical protein